MEAFPTAIIGIVNNSNGNIELATQVLGNSPEVFREHYYTGAERDMVASALSTALSTAG